MVQKKRRIRRGGKRKRVLSDEKPKTFEQQGVSKVTGRIIGLLDDGFVLSEVDGPVDVLFDPAAFQKVADIGDIVEVAGFPESEKSEPLLVNERLLVHQRLSGAQKNIFRAVSVKVLTPCRTDFFLRGSDPSWVRGMVDQSVGERRRVRAAVIQAIRAFFEKERFLEVETPCMVALPGMEPYLDPFVTEFVGAEGSGNIGMDGAVLKHAEMLPSETHSAVLRENVLREKRYLITSPEYALKKLLVSGERKIFQLGKVFRNKETGGALHNPEFTLLEWYRAYCGYTDIMEDTEALVRFVCQVIHGSARFEYAGRTIDTSGPWPRKKVVELFEEYAQIPRDVFEDEVRFRQAVAKKGYNVAALTTYSDLFFAIFLNEIEPKLGFDQPVIVYEYPASMASLARTCPGNPLYAERFELYIAGMELCNAFGELCDPVEQRERLEKEREERVSLGKEDYSVDQSFLRALEFGMPPSGGNALGVDRLVMLMANASDIRDIISFPFFP